MRQRALGVEVLSQVQWGRHGVMGHSLDQAAGLDPAFSGGTAPRGSRVTRGWVCPVIPLLMFHHPNHTGTCES